MLIRDSREEDRLRHEQTTLAQQQEMKQTSQQVLAMLAWSAAKNKDGRILDIASSSL
ncbi:hypothetical protein [Pantoea graminicola]|uniref:hypothetical protein n=1 Tax=Pantoea sp. ARC607 TaxID=2027922 RepID=UPI001F2B1EC5|nr:hypothetical protein [Pantoea sp. ARC607]